MSFEGSILIKSIIESREALNNSSNLFLADRTALVKQAKDDFKDKSRVYYADHLEDAVKLAAEITPEGKSCVMSPAAASYGIFKNFEERGDAFKKLVAGLE